MDTLLLKYDYPSTLFPHLKALQFPSPFPSFIFIPCSNFSFSFLTINIFFFLYISSLFKFFLSFFTIIFPFSFLLSSFISITLFFLPFICLRLSSHRATYAGVHEACYIYVHYMFTIYKIDTDPARDTVVVVVLLLLWLRKCWDGEQQTLSGIWDVTNIHRTNTLFLSYTRLI